MGIQGTGHALSNGLKELQVNVVWVLDGKHLSKTMT